MIPTKALERSISTRLASDTTKLAAATALHVHLIMAAFLSDEETDFTTLTEAVFDGYTDLDADTGTQQSFIDQVNNVQVVQLLEPAGGWHWQVTGLTGLPVDIFGYVVTDTADTVTWGSELFDTPVTLADVGDSIDIPFIRLSIPLGDIT